MYCNVLTLSSRTFNVMAQPGSLLWSVIVTRDCLFDCGLFISSNTTLLFGIIKFDILK